MLSEEILPTTDSIASTGSVLESALHLQSLGFNVVPIRRGTRASHIRWTERRNQIPTAAKVKEWWLQFPDADPGIILDADARIVMLEADSASAEEEFGIYGVPETLTVKSKRGLHRFYEMPEGLPLQCLDRFPVDGGELKVGVLTPMPPAMHVDGGSYSYVDQRPIVDAPTWIVNVVEARAREAVAHPAAVGWGELLRHLVESGELSLPFVGNWSVEGTRPMRCLFANEHANEDAHASAYLVTRDAAGMRCSNARHALTVLDLAVQCGFANSVDEAQAKIKGLGLILPRDQPWQFLKLQKEIAVLHRPVGIYLYQRAADTYQLAHRGDLDTIYANLPKIETANPKKPLDPVEFWLTNRDRREFDEIVFEPGLQRESVYNLWRGWRVEAVQGDCSKYWAHVRDVICDGHEDRFVWLRKWMAHAVQKPRELPETAIVLMGAPGTGKGVFVQQFGKLFEPHFVQVTTMEKLTGRFNAHLGEAMVVFADEATWGGDKQKEGQLKAFITEKRFLLEQKNKPIVEVANCKRLIMASNEAWPVAVGKQDRRYVVFAVSDAKTGDHAYFDALIHEMKSGGLEALMYDLMHEDLVGWRPSKRPKTESAWDLKLRSLDVDMQFWFEFLHDAESRYRRGDDVERISYPNLNAKAGLNSCCVEKDALYEAYCAFAAGRKARSVLKSQFFKTAAMFGDGKNHQHLQGGQRRRGFGLRHIDEARSIYEREAGEASTIWAGADDPVDDSQEPEVEYNVTW